MSNWCFWTLRFWEKKRTRLLVLVAVAFGTSAGHKKQAQLSNTYLPIPTTHDNYFGPATMDCFEILTTSGVVLFQRSYAPVPNVINSLIKDVFIEENVSAQTRSYRKDKYTLKWTVSDLGLIFVVRVADGLEGTWEHAMLMRLSLRPCTSPCSISHGSTSSWKT